MIVRAMALDQVSTGNGNTSRLIRKGSASR